MSADLIAQLNAVTVKMDESANALQEQIKKGKNRNRHYKLLVKKSDKLLATATKRIELAKALARASEKQANPKGKAKAKAKAKASPTEAA